MFLLDSSTCIDMIRSRAPKLLERLLQHKPGEIAISSIVYAELRLGAEKSKDAAAARDALGKFCSVLKILPFDEGAAEEYGRVRAGLERAGTPIGPHDLLIAAHARSLGYTPVTMNRREFERVDGLVVESWGA